MEMRLLDLFSGIGGFSYAAEQIVGQYRTVAFVEREPFCQQILRKHWPEVPIYDDIITFEPELGSADVICGGFPCQDISTAGKQAGIKQGTRSGLFYELMRVVRLVRPQYVILENVAAILANGLDTVLGELAEAGFDAEWACIPASAVGACHQRDRWWLVAYPSCADRARWPKGLGWGLSSESDAGAGRLPQGSWGTDKADPHTKGEQCNDGGFANAAQQARVTPQLGNCDGEDAADTKSSGRRTRQRQGTIQAGYQSARAGNDSAGSDAAYPDSTRSQGQTVPRLQRTGLWRDAPRCLNPDWRSYLSQPVLCRGDDGLSGRVDRLKALGNAVVPQVAAIPLRRVKELARGF